MLRSLISLFFLGSLISSSAHSNSQVITWSGNIYKHIHDYKELHEKFSKKICTPGADSKYATLASQYRSSGYYLPEFNNDIDRMAITKNLYHFQKKINFIGSLYQENAKREKIKAFSEMATPIYTQINELLELKKNYNSEIMSDKRDQIISESRTGLKTLMELYELFLNEYSFMKNYNFPNDHLKNRYEYDLVKDSPTDTDRRKANQVYFMRRIVEDGAMDPDSSRPDVFLRTALDTIYLNLSQEKDFISENVRYDLEWILKNLESHIGRGLQIHLLRLKEWQARTQANYDFYKEIVKLKNKEKAQALVKEKNEATFKLKEFSYSKQAETFLFWKDKPELMKSLFVLETILYNEVGAVDGEGGLERSDVAQVVLNRMHIPFYRTLEKSQELWKYIPLPEAEIQKEHWLNVLFKVGEFSFTYHYIGASAKIFCPDMSRAGKGLRAENLKIALNAIKKYNGKFKAVRYFSRVSMRGKIDMSSVWADYKKVAERPGLETINNFKLAHAYSAGEYRFLYDFIDPSGLKYQVVEIQNKIYSMTWVRGRPKFYHYRSPHLFTYFEQK